MISAAQRQTRQERAKQGQLSAEPVQGATNERDGRSRWHGSSARTWLLGSPSAVGARVELCRSRWMRTKHSRPRACQPGTFLAVLEREQRRKGWPGSTSPGAVHLILTSKRTRFQSLCADWSGGASGVNVNEWCKARAPLPAAPKARSNDFWPTNHHLLQPSLPPRSLTPHSFSPLTSLFKMAPMAREPGQKGVNWSNLAVGGIMNMVSSRPPPLLPQSSPAHLPNHRLSAPTLYVWVRWSFLL